MKCIPVPGLPSLEVLLRGFEMMCPLPRSSLVTWQMLRAPDIPNKAAVLLESELSQFPLEGGRTASCCLLQVWPFHESACLPLWSQSAVAAAAPKAFGVAPMQALS